VCVCVLCTDDGQDGERASEREMTGQSLCRRIPMCFIFARASHDTTIRLYNNIITRILDFSCRVYACTDRETDRRFVGFFRLCVISAPARGGRSGRQAGRPANTYVGRHVGGWVAVGATALLDVCVQGPSSCVIIVWCARKIVFV